MAQKGKGKEHKTRYRRGMPARARRAIFALANTRRILKREKKRKGGLETIYIKKG